MSRKLVISLVLVIISFVSGFTVRSQEIIRTETGDTLITITTHQLNLINCAFSDLRLIEKKLKTQEDLIKTLEQRKNYIDSINASLEEGYRLKNEIYQKNVDHLKNKMEEEKRKKFLMGGSIGIVVGFVIGVLVLK